MTKTQLKQQRSKEWKEINGWDLTQEQRRERTAKRAIEAINEKLENGQDASLLIDLFIESFGYDPLPPKKQEFPDWMKYLSFEQRKEIPGYFQSFDLVNNA